MQQLSEIAETIAPKKPVADAMLYLSPEQTAALEHLILTESPDSKRFTVIGNLMDDWSQMAIKIVKNETCEQVLEIIKKGEPENVETTHKPTK